MISSDPPTSLAGKPVGQNQGRKEVVGMARQQPN